MIEKVVRKHKSQRRRRSMIRLFSAAAVLIAAVVMALFYTGNGAEDAGLHIYADNVGN